MKTIYKNLLNITLSTALCLAITSYSFAQQRDGGSGGSKPSGGGSSGSSASPRSSGGGVTNAPRPAGGSFSNRINSNFPRPQGGAAGVQRQNQNFGNRQGVGVNRGNLSNYPQRVGTVNSNGVAMRGNFNGTQRGAVGISPQRGSANYSPAIGHGGRVNGGGYWGAHNYNHYNHGYYNTYYRPRLGFQIGVLPYGYYPFYYGDYQYFYSDGLYYQYDNSEYTVVDPPIGAQITTLPDKAQSIVINGQQYYELNGVYYQPVTKDDGTVVYQIAGKDGQLDTNTGVQDDQPQGPQMGDIVAQLPPDCRKINVNGQKLYVSADGVYYQELTDGNGAKTYKVVGLPSDEPEQN